MVPEVDCLKRRTTGVSLPLRKARETLLVLKRVISGLRRSGLLPAEVRETLVLLNHNPADPRKPGDVSIFGSIAALVGDLRTVDLLQGGYLAVDTAGRVVAMTPTDAADPESLIDVAVAAHPSEPQLAQRLLKHYLLAMIDDEALNVERAEVEREFQTVQLIALVPPRDISD